MFCALRENDVLYGGRGRRHFHRLANQRFLELVKLCRKEYHESRCKKAVAQRIVKEWQGQSPPGRFLQQDPKTEKWYEIKMAKIMEKTCQALRDLKRERGPAGVKQGISDRMVDPWDKANERGYAKRPMQQQQQPLNGQPMPLQLHQPYPHHHSGTWMGQPSMYPPHQMGAGGIIAPPPPMPYVPVTQHPIPGDHAAGIGQGNPPAKVLENRDEVTPSQKSESKKGNDATQEVKTDSSRQANCESAEAKGSFLAQESQILEANTPIDPPAQSSFLSIQLEEEVGQQGKEENVQAPLKEQKEQQDMETEPAIASALGGEERAGTLDESSTNKAMKTIVHEKDSTHSHDPPTDKSAASKKSNDESEDTATNNSQLNEVEKGDRKKEEVKERKESESSDRSTELSKASTSKEGSSTKDEKQDGQNGKKKGKRKNGELEAATLLANMFR